MTKKKFLIIFYLLFPIFGFSQSHISGEIIYKVNLKPVDISKVTENKKLSKKTKVIGLSL